MPLVDALIYVTYVWGPLLLLATGLFQLQKRYLIYLQKLGGRGLMLLPASFSVPWHELSHYLMAKACGHKVTEMSLFEPNSSGTLGYVRHSYRASPVSPFTNMLIGLAPILGGALITYCLTITIFPSAVNLLSGTDFISHQNALSVSELFISQAMIILTEHYQEPVFWSWFILVANLMVFSVPSPTDFKGAATGIVVTLLVYIGSLVFVGPSSVINEWLHFGMMLFTPLLLLSVGMIGGLVTLLTSLCWLKQFITKSK